MKVASILLTAAALIQAAPWQPATGTKFQIVLNKPIKINSASPTVSPNVPVFDIDLFDNQSNNVIASLHKLNKKVICYFSAGSSEKWRPDYNQIPASAQGKNVDDWQGEKWLNTKDTTVRKVMADRIKLAAQIGCDAVDPDNVDGYANDTGFTLTQADGIDYIKYLAGVAASYNLAIGLKNAQVFSRPSHPLSNSQSTKSARTIMSAPTTPASSGPSLSSRSNTGTTSNGRPTRALR